MGRVSTRNFWLWAIGLHAVYFLYALVQGPNLLNDSQEYLLQAGNLNEGYFAYCGDPSYPLDYFDFSKRPPLYPLILWLCGTTSFWWGILFFQNSLSLLTIYILRNVLQNRGFYNPLWFGVLVSSSIPYFIYVNSIMSEVILVAGVTAMLYHYHNFLKLKKGRAAWLFNLMLAAVVFTKPVFFPFVVINALFWLILHRKYAMSTLLPIVLVALFFWRNTEVTGKPHFSSIAYINLLDYNAYYFNVETKGVAYADSVGDNTHAVLNKTSGFLEKAGYMQSIAIQEIGRDWPAYFWFHLKGAFRGMVDPGNFDLRTFFNADNSVGFLKTLNEKGWQGIPEILNAMPWLYLLLLLISLLNKVLLLLGFLFFILKPGIDPNWRWALTGIVFYVVLITGPINASRFMLAVWPVVIICTVQAFTLKGKVRTLIR
ncbi:MAG: hypothetical protein RLP14_06640 [Owenweeksia sp.]